MKYLKSISMLLLLLPIQVMAQFAWYGEKGFHVKSKNALASKRISCSNSCR